MNEANEFLVSMRSKIETMGCHVSHNLTSFDISWFKVQVLNGPAIYKNPGVNERSYVQWFADWTKTINNMGEVIDN